MLGLAKEIIQLTGSKSKVVFRDLPQDDPKIRQPDITKARETLRWKPAVTRSDGLKRTAAYFAKALGV
jgi:dTDP-glucose 4,6-dehydratase